jgi:DNA polymerase-1
MKKEQPTLLIDTGYFIYRALYANFELSYNEVTTTIYYNLLSSFKSLVKKFKTPNILLFWDSSYSYRKEIFPQYKEKRNKQNQDEEVLEKREILRNEYTNIRKIFKKLGFTSYLRYGLESDDLFFYYIERHPDEQIIIVSRDEDLYQLLTFPNVRMYDPHTKQIIDKKYLSNKYQGLTPEQWIVYKAIGGCNSDGVPGIQGIGEKYTIQYILGECSNKIKNKIESNKDIVSRNLVLVKLPHIHSSKIYPLKSKITIINLEELKNLCFDMGFKSFLQDIKQWDVFNTI